MDIVVFPADNNTFRHRIGNPGRFRIEAVGDDTDDDIPIRNDAGDLV